MHLLKHMGISLCGTAWLIQSVTPAKYEHTHTAHYKCLTHSSATFPDKRMHEGCDVQRRQGTWKEGKRDGKLDTELIWVVSHCERWRNVVSKQSCTWFISIMVAPLWFGDLIFLCNDIIFQELVCQWQVVLLCFCIFCSHHVLKLFVDIVEQGLLFFILLLLIIAKPVRGCRS